MISDEQAWAEASKYVIELETEIERLQEQVQAAQAERDAALLALMQHNPDALTGDIQDWVQAAVEKLAALQACRITKQGW